MADEVEKEISPAPPPQGDGTDAPSTSTPAPTPQGDGSTPATPPPPIPEGQDAPDQSFDDSSDDSSADSSDDSSDSEDPYEKVRIAVEDIDDDLDPAWLEVLKQMARETPETRWRHSSHFSQDEDRIIAAGLASLTAVYKIAQTLRCDRRTLQKHIDEDPMLSQMLADQNLMRREKVQEGVDQLVEIHHPNVIMWAAEHLLSDVYGKDKQMNEEDDSVLVIGEIPESSLAEADAILAAAAETPPEVGLTAMLDERVTSTPVPQPPALPQQPQTPPQPSAPQTPPSTPPSSPQVPPAPPAPPAPPPIVNAPAAQEPAPDPDEGNYVDDSSYGGYNDGYNDFGGGGWLT